MVDLQKQNTQERRAAVYTKSINEKKTVAGTAMSKTLTAKKEKPEYTFSGLKKK